MPFMSESKENTSVNIRPSITKMAKSSAAKKDMSFSAWVEGAIRMRLLLEKDTADHWDKFTDQ